MACDGAFQGEIEVKNLTPSQRGIIGIGCPVVKKMYTELDTL
jgi:hypothetical protein